MLKQSKDSNLPNWVNFIARRGLHVGKSAQPHGKLVSLFSACQHADDEFDFDLGLAWLSFLQDLLERMVLVRRDRFQGLGVL